MKKITLLILLIASFSYAQTNPIDFEAGGNGAAWTWDVFENVDNPALEFVANPDATGNTSATVAKFTARQAGQPWVGTITSGQGTFTLTAANSTVKIWVYKTVISDVGIKFETATQASSGEVKVANTLVNQWEELTFDMSSKIGEATSTDITGLVVFPDFDTRSQENIIYFDNITFSAQVVSSEPTTAAPAPTHPSSDVISMFSDAYTDVTVDTWNTGWSAATFEDVTVAGNATKKYTNLNFNGIETVGANAIDAATPGMTHLHMDVWTPNITAFRVKLVDFLGDGFQGGNGDTEAELSFTPAQSGWVALDIPLADFTAGGMTALTDINQMVISGDPSGSGTIFIDNVYYYKSAATEPTAAAPAPTLPASDVISMFSDVYTDVTVDTWNTGWSAATFEDVTVAGNATKKYTNLNFNGIETVGANAIDAATPGMTHLHMDVWTPNITAFRVKLVDFLGDGFQGGNGDTEAELSFTPAQGGWVALDIPLADFTAAGMTALTDINQMVISGDPSGSGTIFIDNVYYYKTAATEPTAAAPAPTLPSGNVISMFSDVYTDVTVDTWNTGWSAATFEDVTVAGNATKKYTNLNFNGIETVANPIDATTPGMLYFHMDVWTPNITAFRVKLVDFLGDGFQGGNGDTEAELSFTPAQGEWVTIDIPLSDFTAAGMTSMTDINQLVISGDPSGSGTIFIDNVYFATQASLSTEDVDLVDVSAYPNPTSTDWNIRTANTNIKSVEVYNILGKQVLRQKANDTSITIPTNGLSRGIYIARIATELGTTSMKLIKE